MILTPPEYGYDAQLTGIWFITSCAILPDFLTVTWVWTSVAMFLYIKFTGRDMISGFGGVWARSFKRSDTLFQLSLLLFLTWREYFYSQPTYYSSQPRK